MHYDLPWFRSKFKFQDNEPSNVVSLFCSDGANRHNTPQWLLLAMAGSGLWEEDLLPQVQGVAYIHQNQTIHGGDFFLYPYGPGAPAVVAPADANSAIVVNGIKVRNEP